MKFLPAVILTALLAFGCAPPKPVLLPETPTVSPTTVVLRSIVRLVGELPNGDGWICTGFSIAPRKFLTAAHCTDHLHEMLGGILTANGKLTAVIKEDHVHDLAIILADILQPSLSLRLTPLEFLERVSAAGFGHGFRGPLVTDHKVMLHNYILLEGIAPGTVFTNPFVGGMSGGPIFDVSGEVVGMVQRGSNFVGYGVDSATILAFINGE